MDSRMSIILHIPTGERISFPFRSAIVYPIIPVSQCPTLLSCYYPFSGHGKYCTLEAASWSFSIVRIVLLLDDGKSLSILRLQVTWLTM